MVRDEEDGSSIYLYQGAAPLWPGGCWPKSPPLLPQHSCGDRAPTSARPPLQVMPPRWSSTRAAASPSRSPAAPASGSGPSGASTGSAARRWASPSWCAAARPPARLHACLPAAAGSSPPAACPAPAPTPQAYDCVGEPAVDAARLLLQRMLQASPPAVLQRLREAQCRVGPSSACTALGLHRVWARHLAPLRPCGQWA
jgi:hypothetical protein